MAAHIFIALQEIHARELAMDERAVLTIGTMNADTFRAEAAVEFGSGCPTLVNDRELSVCTEKYVRELLGNDKTFSVAELSAKSGGKSSKTAGSEDFAYVSQCVPSIMLALAAGRPEDGYLYSQHHPMVKFDESVLVDGSAVYAYAALRWLEEHKK